MYECKASVYMTQGRVCPSLDNDFYVVAAPLSEGKEIEEGIPTEEELPKVRRSGDRLDAKTILSD